MDRFMAVQNLGNSRFTKRTSTKFGKVPWLITGLHKMMYGKFGCCLKENYVCAQVWHNLQRGLSLYGKVSSLNYPIVVMYNFWKLMSAPYMFPSPCDGSYLPENTESYCTDLPQKWIWTKNTAWKCHEMPIFRFKCQILEVRLSELNMPTTSSHDFQQILSPTNVAYCGPLYLPSDHQRYWGLVFTFDFQMTTWDDLQMSGVQKNMATLGSSWISSNKIIYSNTKATFDPCSRRCDSVLRAMHIIHWEFSMLRLALLYFWRPIMRFLSPAKLLPCPLILILAPVSSWIFLVWQPDPRGAAVTCSECSWVISFCETSSCHVASCESIHARVHQMNRFYFSSRIGGVAGLWFGAARGPS